MSFRRLFRVLWPFLAVLLATSGPLGARDRSPAAAPEPVVAITHATVLTVTRGTIEDGTVLIRGGRVAAVGKGLSIPAGAEVGLEAQAAQIDWDRAVSALRPPQSWFDDDDNPFEPEMNLAS
jgi:hypothetical protein